MQFSMSKSKLFWLPRFCLSRPCPAVYPDTMGTSETMAAIRYWFAVSILAWGLLSLAGMYWRPFRASSAVTILLAAAVGCVANWFRNRTLHCGITAPVFLAGGVAFLLSDMRIVHINSRVLWPFIFTGIGIAFLLEWRWVRR
jgi:hypothetical protein